MLNFFDKIIGYFIPGYAAKAAQLRYTTKVLEGRAFDAAGNGRRNKNSRATSAGPNTENAGALVQLRNRSREMVRNNPYAWKAVTVIRNNVVGTGIMPSVTAEASTPSAAAKAEAKVKMLFNRWAKRCEIGNGLSLNFVQRMIVQTEAISGEVLIIRKRTKFEKGKVPLKLQILEPDQLDHTKDGIPTQGGGMVHYGVEFNAMGERVAYYIWDKHPGENGVGSYESKRIPAEDVIHVYEVVRPGQVRGVPRGVSCMVRLKDLDEFEDAQLIRQKIAACFTAFVQSSDGLFDDEEEEPEMIMPGAITRLRPNETVTFGSPPAADGYDVFSKRVLFSIAAGYGITYESLTNDLSNVNYSSYRAGWTEANHNYSMIQDDIVIPALDRIWDWFNDAAIDAGLLTKVYDVSWTKPKRVMIDPVKETAAMKDQVRNGFVSWSEAVRQQGYDPDETAQEIARDQQRFDELGLVLDCDPRVEQQAKQAEAPPQNPEENGSNTN